MSSFSMETSQGQVFASRQSSVYTVTSYHAQHPQHQRLASGLPFLRQDLVDNNDCIPEERESYPSPSQYRSEIECGRESLAERPELEGPIQNPVMMPVSTPFSVQSFSTRQIPISNHLSDHSNGELVSRIERLQISESGYQERTDTDAEIEQQEAEDLAELDVNGPNDTAGLQVYATPQHFANMKTLSQ